MKAAIISELKMKAETEQNRKSQVMLSSAGSAMFALFCGNMKLLRRRNIRALRLHQTRLV